MADIIQAAKWMQEGLKVRRLGFFGNFAYVGIKSSRSRITKITTTENNMEDEPFDITDLLADDWETFND